MTEDLEMDAVRKGSSLAQDLLDAERIERAIPKRLPEHPTMPCIFGPDHRPSPAPPIPEHVRAAFEPKPAPVSPKPEGA